MSFEVKAGWRGGETLNSERFGFLFFFKWGKKEQREATARPPFLLLPHLHAVPEP